jgi:hypothetical protein
VKIENQTCSRELGQKLAELGVTAESLFKWVWYNKSPITGKPTIPAIAYDCMSLKGESFPAYTVAELGEMLPSVINPTKRSIHSLLTQKDESGQWDVFYMNVRDQVYGKAHFYADTEADARALMLIWLIENKHIEVPS